MTIPFVRVPVLQTPTLGKYDGIVTGTGTTTSLFQRWWQGIIKSLTGTTDALVENQNYLQQVADYTIAESQWLEELGRFTLERVAYLQLAVAAIAADTGTILPDPSGLPPYPGDPPESPF